MFTKWLESARGTARVTRVRELGTKLDFRIQPVAKGGSGVEAVGLKADEPKKKKKTLMETIKELSKQAATKAFLKATPCPLCTAEGREEVVHDFRGSLLTGYSPESCHGQVTT